MGRSVTCAVFSSIGGDRAVVASLAVRKICFIPFALALSGGCGEAPGSGVALPQCLHGGPGRAGGGEELGGLQGVKLYMQRVALQGARPVVDALAGIEPPD